MDKNIFKGIAEIIIYDIQPDGSLKENFRHVQSNKILVRALELLIDRKRVFHNDNENNVNGNNNDFRARRIAISTEQEPESFSKRQFTNSILATGDASLISDSYIRTPESETEPANVVYKNRFLAPSVNRTFYSLGIAENALRVRETTGATDPILTYILLNTPIQQTTTQVLDINYKIFIDWENSTYDINENGRKDIEKLFLGDFTNNANLYPGFQRNLYVYGNTIDDNDEGLNLFVWPYLQEIASRGRDLVLLEFKDVPNLTYRYGASGKPFVGSFFRGVQYGGWFPHNPAVSNYIDREFVNKTSNLSSVYSHSVGANKPMYDGNKLANSSWQPVISDDNNTKEFPSHYILKVSKEGGEGVGEYKLYKEGWGGWNGNSYTDQIGTPFLHFDLSRYYINPSEVETDYDCYNHRWNYTWSYAPNEHYFVSYVRNKGVCLFKLSSENLEVIKKYKLGSDFVGADYIEDIEVLPEEELIYVATRQGLFKVDTSTDTITTEINDKCLAVVAGYQNKVFGVFFDNTDIGRISNSDDYTIALSDGTTLPTSELPDYSKAWRLYIDKESTNYEMMLIVGRVEKGIFGELLSGAHPDSYYIYWRNESEYVKRQIVKTRNVYNRSIQAGDLICFPSNNSVICDNGLWIYPDVKHYIETLQSRYFFDTNHGEDLKQDFINQGWNTRQANYYNWFSVSLISDDSSLYTFPTNSTDRRYTASRSEIAISKFAEDRLAFYRSHMASPGSLVKGKLDTEGNQYSVILTMESSINVTTHSDNPISGVGNIQAYQEGTTEPAANRWTGFAYSTPDRLTYLIKLDIDLDTNTVTVDAKGQTETRSLRSLRSHNHPDFGSIRVTDEKQLIVFPKVGTAASRGFYMLSPFRVPDEDLKDTIIQAYSWDGTGWIKDDDNTGPGRPLHTTNESLINGLSVQWNDLQPSNTQDLIEDQYYTFTRTTAPNMVSIEEHTPDLSFYYWFSLRRRINTSHTEVVPSNRFIYVPESPDGTAPDPEWHALANTGLLNRARLDGEEINITSNANTNPPAGTAYYDRSLGRFYFNAADVGKTATIEYTYYKKYDATE